uniref:TTF-type domain-containing protein n=2 Tax=Latimeria chalumnae TaxID=7897 RepID=H3ABI7_LATCH
FQFPKRLMGSGGGQRYRRFNPHLLLEYKFARYSRYSDAVFCGPCFVFNSSKETVLVSRPMTDWSNGKKILERHSKSKDHRNAATRADAFVNVCTGQLKMSCKKPVAQDQAITDHTRHILRRITSILILCGRQNIALRGRLPSSGNFKALFQHTVEIDPLLKKHLEFAPCSALHTSAKIHNKLIQLIGLQIQQKILSLVKKAKFFTLQAAGTAHFSKKGELIILVVRYIYRHKDEQVELREDFIELAEVPDATGEALANLFLQRLAAWDIEREHLRGQSYERGSSASGRFNGVQERVCAVLPAAAYTICKTHDFKMSILHSCAIHQVANMLDTCGKVLSVLRSSVMHYSMHLAELKEFINLPTEHNDAEEQERSASLCSPRSPQWISQADGLHSFKAKFVAIVHSLEQIAQYESDAERLLYSITRFNFVVSLVCVVSALAITKPLHLYLQREDVDLIQASEEASDVIEVLRSMREDADAGFAELYAEAKRLAGVALIEESVPRICGRITPQYSSAATTQDYYKTNIFQPFLDHMMSELQEQLIQCRPRFLAQYLLPNKLHLLQKETAVAALYSAYKADISSPENLKAELLRWTTKWRSVTREDRPNTILATLQQLNPAFYPEINAALCILATMAVNVTTVESASSVLHRIKTWLKNSDSESWLTGLALLYAHQDIPVDVEQVLKDF